MYFESLYNLTQNSQTSEPRNCRKVEKLEFATVCLQSDSCTEMSLNLSAQSRIKTKIQQIR